MRNNLLYNKLNNKKAVSLMLSYVILISIVLVTSITIFAWLKLIANVEPVINCDVGTSLIINEYKCDINLFNLTLMNNGRFNVDGFIMSVGDDVYRIPIDRLIPFELNRLSNEGYYIYEQPLKPGLVNSTLFTNNADSGNGIGIVNYNFVRNIRIQPLVFDDVTGNAVLCSNAVIKQEVVDCQIK